MCKSTNEEYAEENEDTTGNDWSKKKNKKKEQIKEIQVDKQGKKVKQLQNTANNDKGSDKPQKQMLTIERQLTKANLNALDKSTKKENFRKRMNTAGRNTNDDNTEKAVSECESAMIDAASKAEEDGDGNVKDDEKSNEEESIKKQFWMSFEDFYKSFRYDKR